MNLIVVRHGITEFNKQERLNGLIDESLAEEGQQQARELVDRLSGKPIDAIYTSPLKRTVETAEPIAKKLGLPINPDRRIIEVDFGQLTGKTQTEVDAMLGQTMVEMLSSYNYDFHELSGESVEGVNQRVSSFINELKTKDHQTVLIITHGGIIRMINYVVTGQKIGFQPNAKEIDLTI
jgi:broad specificity phosphatase PhoE